MGLVKNCSQWYSVYLGFIRLCLRGYWDYWLVQGAIWTKSNVDIRNVILSCIIWNIWVEPNACVFEANGQSILELTMFCLHLMHDWMSVKWTEASHWCLLKRTCLQLTKLKTRYLIWDTVFFFFLIYLIWDKGIKIKTPTSICIHKMTYDRLKDLSTCACGRSRVWKVCDMVKKG